MNETLRQRVFYLSKPAHFEAWDFFFFFSCKAEFAFRFTMRLGLPWSWGCEHDPIGLAWCTNLFGLFSLLFIIVVTELNSAVSDTGDQKDFCIKRITSVSAVCQLCCHRSEGKACKAQVIGG